MKVERQEKVLIKNLANFFLFPASSFCRNHSNSTVGNFSLNQKEQWLENNDGIFQAQQFNLYFAKYVCLLCHWSPSWPIHPPPPHCVYSLSRYFGRKVKLGPANRRQKLGLVWRNRKKISPNYQWLPLLTVLPLNYFMDGGILCSFWASLCVKRWNFKATQRFKLSGKKVILKFIFSELFSSHFCLKMLDFLVCQFKCIFYQNILIFTFAKILTHSPAQHLLSKKTAVFCDFYLQRYSSYNL